MSTKLDTVTGKRELPDPEHHKSIYYEESIFLTSFHGEPKRGQCISMTIPSGQIQLTEENVEKLIGILQKWIDR